MKIAPVQYQKNITHKSRLSSSKAGKVVVAALPLFASAKDAAAHTSPFFHMHDINGNTVGMGAGILMFIGVAVATGIAIIRKSRNQSEKVNKDN